MEKIIVSFRYDRWEVIRKYGFRESLIAHCTTKSAAQKIAKQYREAGL